MMELLALLLVIWAVVSALFCITRSMNDETRGYPWREPKKGRIKTNFNGVALVMNIYDYLISVDWQGKFTPKSPLQREIMQEEKEIKQLERQKADMERLKSAKRRKEELFQEVNGEEDELNFDPIKEEGHPRLGVYEVTVYEDHLPSLNTHGIRATSMDEAIEKFKRDNPDITYFEIKEVMRG